METVKQLILKADFSKEVADAAFSDFGRSMTYLYQGNWFRFLHWGHGRNIAPGKATFQQLAKFFCMQKESMLSKSVIKGYRLGLSHVFILSWMDITSDRFKDLKATNKRQDDGAGILH